MKRLRGNLLFSLTLWILLPSVFVLALAAAGTFQVQRSMASMARSYVQNLGENIVERVDLARSIWRAPSQDTLIRPRRLPPFQFLSQSVSLPAVVAVLNDGGFLIFGSYGAEKAQSLWDPNMPRGRAFEAYDRDGEKYTIVCYATSVGEYVVATVAWSALFGPLQWITVWPFFFAVAGVIGLYAVYRLWRKVIHPLKDLENEVTSLRWGRDIPAHDVPESVFELQRLREAFGQLALAAIDRERLTQGYVSDLVRAQEQERERLSRDIHDGPLQDVTALIQRIHLARMERHDPKEVARQLAISEEVARTSVKELRGLCDQLTPPWLDLGLEHAVIELSERVTQQTGADIVLDFDNMDDLSPEITLALFRVIQEGLSNSIRHGMADWVRIRVFYAEEEKSVVLEIEDHGQGFQVPEEIASLRVHGHRGLANMSERMVLVGGTIQITSTPGKGTSIRCTIPWERDGSDSSQPEQPQSVMNV